MSRKTVLALSVALSAFILILAGAAAGLALRPVAPPATATASVPADIVRAREAQYRRLIEEANARLRAQAVTARAAAAQPARLTARDPEAEGDDEHERHEHHGRRHEREDDDG